MRRYSLFNHEVESYVAVENDSRGQIQRVPRDKRKTEAIFDR